MTLIQNYIIYWKNLSVRKATLKQGFSVVKSVVVIIMVLTKNFLPQKLGRNQKEPLGHTIKRLIWVLSLNILLWECLKNQMKNFSFFYNVYEKMFAYIVLAVPLIYVCICSIMVFKNCFSQNQQAKVRFLMISGLFLLFEISTLMSNYKIYFILKYQNWDIPVILTVHTSSYLYLAAVFAKMAFPLPSLRLTDMYNLEKISCLDKTCGASNVLVFSSVFLSLIYIFFAAYNGY